MRRKRLCIGLICVVFVSAAALFLWTAETESKAHYTPEYAMQDLEPLLQKEALSEEDYAVLFRQTGLGKCGVDELLGEGRQSELLFLQKRFFAPVEYECCQANVFCRSERLIAGAEEHRGRGAEAEEQEHVGREAEAEEQEHAGREAEAEEQEHAGREAVSETQAAEVLPTVRDGDILVTFSGHFFGWRSGHAGVVVDAEEGVVLEAVAVGYDSEFCALKYWENYPCFVLLRLKDSTEEETAEIAAYAAEYLAGVPYRLLSFTQKTESAAEISGMISGTQCAHLVWAAYAHFGYDLDGDGGKIVTPADLCESDLLEVVQIYGMEPGEKKAVLR